MKTKIISIAAFAFLMLSIMLIGTASACTQTYNYGYSNQCSYQNYCSSLKLPTSTVTMSINEPVYPFIITISGVPKGYDVANGTYTGWCVDLHGLISHGYPYTSTLSSSLSSSPPFGTKAQWSLVNYILNHKVGTGPDIQSAIWLAMGFTVEQINAEGFSVSSIAINMYNDAVKNVGNYSSCFCYDKIIAVIVYTPGSQTTIIEVKTPCGYTNWGCYWDKSNCNWNCDYSGYNWCRNSWNWDCNNNYGRYTWGCDWSRSYFNWGWRC